VLFRSSIPVLAYLLWEAGRLSNLVASAVTAVLLIGCAFGAIALYRYIAPWYVWKIGEAAIPIGPWVILLAGALACVLRLFWQGARTEEGGRMVVIVGLCCFSMLFWGFFELAGSTITRFTEQKIDRFIFGWELPAAFVVNFINPFLIIALSIPFSWLWIWLDRRRAEPSSPIKFSLGLLQLGLGFVMFWLGAQQAERTGMSSLIWLLLGFLLFTTGELCLSPVGLSMITKLSPARLVGMFMGVWFLSSALANVFAGQVGGMTQEHGFAAVFLGIAATTGVAAVLLFVLAPIMKRLMHGVK